MKTPGFITFILLGMMVLLLANCVKNGPVDNQVDEIEPNEVILDVIPDSLPLADTTSISKTQTETFVEQEIDSNPIVKTVRIIEEYEETILTIRDDLEMLPCSSIPTYGLSYRYAFKHERRLAANKILICQVEQISKNKIRITVLGSISPYYLPVENNFSKLDYPWGGSIEFSKQNWPVSFGVGYNAMKAQSNSQVYHLQTNNIYLFGKYTPLKLFNDQLEFFLSAGVNSWASQISNVKYPEHAGYYPIETNRGYSYYGGAGTLFEFHKFLIGIQYQLYGTPLVVFGADFNEPDTQEGLKDYTPSTQYKLYAGSNQLQIIVGFRIN
ncbi:MAG: hypothetical protein KAH17_02020 [Bacteroidales bacterium]|nr:hypothetical protein [Bacteroidales bacterium]